MHRCGRCLIVAGFVLAAGWTNPGGNAQSGSSIRGFSPAQEQDQRKWEEKMRALPQPDLLREYMTNLASEPHAVGSAKDKANAEWILNKFKSWGYQASIEEYQVLFPTPKQRMVELLEPIRYEAKLQEPAVAEDPDSTDAGQLPTYNAYSVD